MQWQVFSPKLVSPVVSFSGIFTTHYEHLLSETLESVYYFFDDNMSSKNLLSSFLCFFNKSDALYLFPTNWVLSNLLFKDFTCIQMKV